MHASTRNVFIAALRPICLTAFGLALMTGAACLAAPPAVITENGNDRPDDAAGLGVIVSDSPGEGVLVREVMPQSPAEAAGIVPGDFIIRIDDHPVLKPEDLSSKIQSKKVGDRVQIECWRDGDLSTKEIRLDASVSSATTTGRAWLGVTLDPTNISGARIAMVDPTGPAGRGKLRSGDIITAIGEKPITSTTDLVDAISESKPGEKIALTITRNGVEQALKVELGEVSDAPFSAFRMPWQIDSGAIPLPDGVTIPGLPPLNRSIVPRVEKAPWRKEIEELRKEMQQLRERFRDNATEETSPLSPKDDDDA